MVLEAFASPEVLQAAGMEFVNFLMRVVLAIIIVVVGWAVGSILAKVVSKVFEKIKFEAFLKSHKIHDALGSTRIENVLVQLVKYYVIILFLADALKLVSLGTIGNLLFELVNFTPVALSGAIVVIIAAMVGELAKEKILEVSSSKSWLTAGVAKATKILVIYVGLVVALGTMGFQVTILEQTFLTLLQAVTYGIALAFAIAFGLGGQDDAKDVMKKARKKFNL